MFRILNWWWKQGSDMDVGVLIDKQTLYLQTQWWNGFLHHGLNIKGLNSAHTIKQAFERSTFHQAMPNFTHMYQFVWA